MTNLHASPENASDSPKWGPTLKLVVGLTMVAVVAGLVLRFHEIIGPLLLAIILAYVVHPLANWLSKSTRLSWRASVNLIYLVVIMLLLGSFTVTGVAVVQQGQSLVADIRTFVNGLPQLVQDISGQVYQIGPFILDTNQLLKQFDIQTLASQIPGLVQPVLGQAGGLLSVLASGTIATMGWGLFVLLVSYFILADAGQVPDLVSGIEIPGYDNDFREIGRRLGRIWNAFMRGQLTIIALTVGSYLVLFSIFGVRNALALALLAGAARLVPYLGPLINWSTLSVVAYFQPANYFGLEQWQFVLLLLVCAIIVDQIFDNLISPRIYSSALNVHPAAVLVTAIIAANFIGFIGLLMAAPVLATLTLFSKYAMRKMLDLPPWPEEEKQEATGAFGFSAITRLYIRVQTYLHKRKTASEKQIAEEKS